MVINGLMGEETSLLPRRRNVVSVEKVRIAMQPVASIARFASLASSNQRSVQSHARIALLTHTERLLEPQS